jgi:hypothetical protein
MINMTHEQLAEIGSDKLPSLPWDLRVHFVSRMFHYMMTLGCAREPHTPPWVGLEWACRDLSYGARQFSLLIIMIGHGDGGEGTTSTEMFLQMQFLDSRSNCHRYFSLRIQEWGIQYIYREQSGMVSVVQCQHGDLRQRLAWDPGIAGLSISLTDRGEWTFARESCFDFPLSFSVEEITSLEGVSREVLQYLTLASACAVDGGRVDLGRDLEDGLIPG